jgi:hypothetical protein
MDGSWRKRTDFRRFTPAEKFNYVGHLQHPTHSFNHIPSRLGRNDLNSQPYGPNFNLAEVALRANAVRRINLHTRTNIEIDVCRSRLSVRRAGWKVQVWTNYTIVLRENGVTSMIQQNVDHVKVGFRASVFRLLRSAETAVKQPQSGGKSFHPFQLGQSLRYRYEILHTRSPISKDLLCKIWC